MMGRHSYTLTGDIEWADVGAFSSIAAGCTIHGNDNHSWVYNRNLVSTWPFSSKWDVDFWPKDAEGGKRTQIGNDVWIGSSVNIIWGSDIGDGAIIGGHSTVAGKIPPYAIVVGNPALVKKYRFTESQINELLKIKWWDWDDKKIFDNLRYMMDIDDFINRFKV